MNHILSAARSVALLTLFAWSAASCDDPTTPSGSMTRVLITDAPFPYTWIARVDIHVVSVSVSLSPDTGTSGEFVTIATPNRKVNLLGLTNGLTEELGAAPLPTGAITAVRLVIDTDLSSMTTVNGFVITDKVFSPSIQWQSSAGRPVLNALVHEQISVPDSGAVVVIDFDVGKTFLRNQDINPGSLDSGFVFSPVLRAVDARRTGSIRGTVRALGATGALVHRAPIHLYLGNPNQPENTWSLMSTGVSDANGNFVLPYVTRSAYWSSIPAHAASAYIVTADPPNGGSGMGRAVVKNVSVAAGVETHIGTAILP